MILLLIGTFGGGNILTAQLSDSTGSFTNPIDIVSLPATTGDTIRVTIPAATPAGSEYRIRILGSDPEITGPDNGFDITITTPPTWYIDADGDGYGNPNVNILACSQPAGYVSNFADCADDDPQHNPDTPEICNGIDDDCDGLVDEFLPTGIVLYLPFNGDVNDYSGYGHPVTNAGNGMVSSMDRFGVLGHARLAQQFCLSGDWVGMGGLSIPDAPVLRPSSITIATWVKIAYPTVILNCAPNQMLEQNIIRKVLGTNNTSFRLHWTTTDFVASGPPNGLLDEGFTNGWRHVAWTFDANTMLCGLYVDGVLLATATASGAIDYDNGDIIIGNANGSFDDVMMFDRALSLTEIQTVMNNNGVLLPPPVEVCNGLDDDCDGVVDDGIGPIWFADADGDTYGNAAITDQACNQPVGYVSDSTDCNDADASVNPGIADDPCGGPDADCDGWPGETPVPQYSGLFSWAGPPVSAVVNNVIGGSSIARDESGNLYTVGLLGNAASVTIGCQTVAASNDLTLTKTSANGTHQWTFPFGSTAHDGSATEATVFWFNGELIVAYAVGAGGASFHVNGTVIPAVLQGPVYLHRFTPNGVYMGTLAQLEIGITTPIILSDGSFYYGKNGGQVKKYTPGVGISTVFTISFADGFGLYQIARMPNGDLIVAGETWDHVTCGGMTLYRSGDALRYMYRVNTANQAVWGRVFYQYDGLSMAGDAAGNMYISGNTGQVGGVWKWDGTTFGTQSGSALLKLNPNGTPAWCKYFGVNILHKAHLTADQKLMVLGKYHGGGFSPLGVPALPYNDGGMLYMMKLDTAGTKVWVEAFGTGGGLGGFVTPDDVSYYITTTQNDPARYGCINSPYVGGMSISKLNDVQIELCNGVDDDCDGLVDTADPSYHVFYVDADGDGAGSSTPAAGDGYGTPPPGRSVACDDCDDGNSGVYPLALELCNGIDENCDGLVDAQLPTGLVLDLPFSGTATDIGPNALVATVYNATLTADRFGQVDKAFHFNGTNARIEITDHPTLRPTNLTVSCWVKMTGTAGAQYQCLVAKAVGTGDLDSFTPAYDQNNSTIGGFACNSGTCTSVFAGSPLLSGWRHLTLVFNDATDVMSIYLNGNLVGSVPTALTLAYDTNPLTIGCDRVNNGGYGYFANADIDEVMLFDRALSANEIMSVYRVTSSPAVETQQYVLDADGDQYYPGTYLNACAPPGGGYVPIGTLQPGDCNDAQATAHPGGQEVICNGIDEDCDGMDIPGPVVGGRSLAFDGSADRVVITNGPGIQPTGNMTVECWARSTGPTWSHYGMLVSKRDAFMLNPRLGEKTMNFDVYFAGGGGGGLSYTPGASFDLTQWHHYAGTRNAATGAIKLYIDGVQVAEAVGTGDALGTTGDLYLGEDHCCSDRWLNGGLDEVRLWNVERSACEIRTAMNTKVGIYSPGLMAYYDFDEVSATPGGTNAGVNILVDRAPAYGTNNGAMLGFTLSGTASNWSADHGTVPLTWYQDADGDGYGSTATVITNAYQPCGYGCAPVQGGDCDDTQATVHPGATEICDGLDNDCDGSTDLFTPALPGLKASLPFSGNANDASGNGNNGTVVGATLTTDRFGQPNSAYQFNGISDHIAFAGPPMTNTDNWAMSLWAKPASFAGEGCAIMIGSDAGGPGPNTGYSLLVTSGGVLTGLSSGIAWMGSGATLPNTGTWYHLVMTRNAGVTRFYVNGSQTPNTNGIGFNTPIGFRIGGQLGVRFFDGTLDDVLVYDQGLSASQVAQLYAVLAPPTEICNGLDDDCDGSVDEGLNCAMQISARVFLEGPYNTGTGLMNDALRSLGTFPLTDPYPGLGYTHIGSGNGGSVAPAVIAAGGNDAIVDWVLLELRSPAAPASIIASRSALVQRDGDIVELDGVSPVSFAVAANSYHVAVRQRNHLGCMTASPVALSSTTTPVDFTTNATTTYGTAARKSVTGTFAAEVLWAGDVTFNGEVKYTGSGNDRDPILVRIGNQTPNNVVSGYHGTDVNMDGNAMYTGSGNDRDPILVNIGNSTPNNIRVQQLP